MPPDLLDNLLRHIARALNPVLPYLNDRGRHVAATLTAGYFFAAVGVLLSVVVHPVQGGLIYGVGALMLLSAPFIWIEPLLNNWVKGVVVLMYTAYCYGHAARAVNQLLSVDATLLPTATAAVTAYYFVSVPLVDESLWGRSMLFAVAGVIAVLIMRIMRRLELIQVSTDALIAIVVTAIWPGFQVVLKSLDHEDLGFTAGLAKGVALWGDFQKHHRCIEPELLGVPVLMLGDEKVLAVRRRQLPPRPRPPGLPPHPAEGESPVEHDFTVQSCSLGFSK